MSSFPSRSDLRAVIPDRCFRPTLARSSAYLVFDIAVLALIYWALSVTDALWLKLPLIFLAGTMLWSIFVLGHEAGHGAFAKTRTTNTLIGLLTHVPLLVPFRGWQRSHTLHHMRTGHLHQEEVFRAFRQHEDSTFRKVLFRSGIFVLIGWPMYLLGFRNIKTYNPIGGSHFLPVSDLYASHIKWSWLASVLGVVAFLGLYLWLGAEYGAEFALTYIWGPYFVYGAWLTFVTYMQHVAPEVPVYAEGDWNEVKGALATVDRNYGPFNWLTHHASDLHVIHHIFPTIPHYRAAEAMAAVRPLLGDHYITSDRFVLADFVRSLVGCHFVEPGNGREVWKSAYRFVRTAANTHGTSSDAA